MFQCERERRKGSKVFKKAAGETCVGSSNGEKFVGADDGEGSIRDDWGAEGAGTGAANGDTGGCGRGGGDSFVSSPVSDEEVNDSLWVHPSPLH